MPFQQQKSWTNVDNFWEKGQLVFLIFVKKYHEQCACSNVRLVCASSSSCVVISNVRASACECKCKGVVLRASSNVHVVTSPELSGLITTRTCIATLAYKLLGLLRWSFSSSIYVTTKKLPYTALIRTRMSYTFSVFCPHLVKDIQLLEKYSK